MSDKIYSVPAEWTKRAWLDDAKYEDMYARSVKDPNGFWGQEARRIHWFTAPTTIRNVTFGPGDVSIKWFEDGVTNVAYNCIDRHLPSAATRSPSSGKATIPGPTARSPTGSFMSKSAGLPMC